MKWKPIAWAAGNRSTVLISASANSRPSTRLLYVYAYDLLQLIIGGLLSFATMTAFPDGRRYLAAMFVPLARALVAREEPALLAHDVSMWGYDVLTALAEQTVRTQAALAQVIGE